MKLTIMKRENIKVKQFMAVTQTSAIVHSREAERPNTYNSPIQIHWIRQPPHALIQIYMRFNLYYFFTL